MREPKHQHAYITSNLHSDTAIQLTGSAQCCQCYQANLKVIAYSNYKFK
jgi:hypothetical protein